MKKGLKITFVAFLLALMLLPAASAIVPYTTYTYDIDGNFVESPHAYVPDTIIDSTAMGLSTPLQAPTDLETDDDGNVYIADPVNNRIVVLNADYTFNRVISSFCNTQGVPDSFKSCQGVFIRGDDIYVCDTENNRIIVFKKTTDENGRVTDIQYDHWVLQPQSSAFERNEVYKPVACSVDAAGRIYVVSSTTNKGIISMNAAGGFLGFLGAQRSAPSAWQVFWRMFQTKAQRSALISLVPTEYNNITIDDSGFIYVTISSLDEAKVKSSISSHSTAGTYAPVKKLNAQGEDVMLRTGFWPPSGEVTVVAQNNVGRDAVTGVSLITDVALGEAGTWTIVDSRRQRFYTYDSQGNLLYIFGDNGVQIGNNQGVSSICYQGSVFLVLDKQSSAFTTYKRTEYGDFLTEAVLNVEQRNYDRSAEYWKQVLLRNSNFDEAYIGIADSYYRIGDYENAEKYYAYAYDAEGYSKSYSRIRKAWIEKYIILIPIVVIAIAVGISLFFRWAKKVNDRGQVIKEKRSFWEAAIYGAHIIFHPFDGFWDLKHEKRGNLKAAIFFVVLTIAGFVYNDVGQSFWYDPQNSGISIFSEIIGVLLPLALFVIANWCLTTLFEGEGNMKDIVIAASYSLIPLPMMMIPATILTHVFTLDESAIISLLISIGYIWTGFLLFFGIMVTHDYTLGKNVLTILGTLVAMVFIMFILFLFSGLLSKILSFVENIYTELSLRVS